MGLGFKETATLNTDLQKFDDNFSKIDWSGMKTNYSEKFLAKKHTKEIYVEAIQFKDNHKKCEELLGKGNYDNTVNYPNAYTPDGPVRVEEGDFIVKIIRDHGSFFQFEVYPEEAFHKIFRACTHDEAVTYYLNLPRKDKHELIEICDGLIRKGLIVNYSLQGQVRGEEPKIILHLNKPIEEIVVDDIKVTI